MKSFIQSTLIACISALSLDLEQASTDGWTTVEVSPPPQKCCTEEWFDNNECNVLQKAVNDAEEKTIIKIAAGQYCNEGWFSHGAKAPADRTHGTLVKISKKKNLKLVAADSNDAPLLSFDGWGGITVVNSEGITIRGLEIEGPSLQITASEASKQRQRLTGRDSWWNCGEAETKWQCNKKEQCKWKGSDPKDGECIGELWSYYNGKGIQIKNSNDVTVQRNTVHHTPSSGIRCDKCDDVAIKGNVVYGTSWWTTTGASAIVFAESKGSGTNSINSNVVYGNRNCLPFYQTEEVAHFGAGVENYGQHNQNRIVDGSGVYITRNVDYEGTFNLNNNIAFDNGINGLVVHKTTHPDVTVNVKNNRIFDNGRTTSDKNEGEGRQNAGGLTVNTGTEEGNLNLLNNKVTASNAPDSAYQCFGVCNVIEASNNSVCGGAPSKKLYANGEGSSTCETKDGFQCFDEDECAQQKAANDAIREEYPDAEMPTGVVYTLFDRSEQASQGSTGGHH